MANYRWLLLAVLLVMSLRLPKASAGRAAVHPSGLPVVYDNPQYHFRFFLPENLQGYAVQLQQWHADPAISGDYGPVIVLRSPKWGGNQSYQDIPILVFMRRQWDFERGEDNFGEFAGGIEYEISHNAKYVFAIWSRFNWDDSIAGAGEGQETVDRNIVAGEPHLPESQE